MGHSRPCPVPTSSLPALLCFCVLVSAHTIPKETGLAAGAVPVCLPAAGAQSFPLSCSERVASPVGQTRGQDKQMAPVTGGVLLCILGIHGFQLPLSQSWLAIPLLPDWKLHFCPPSFGERYRGFGDLCSWATQHLGTLYLGARSSTPFLTPRRCTCPDGWASVAALHTDFLVLICTSVADVNLFGSTE